MLRIRPLGIPVLNRFCAPRNLILAVSLAGFAHAAQAADKVKGDLIQFTENGGWCWYQDERVVVDVKRGEMAVSALANAAGVGGAARNGDVDVVLFDLKTRQSKRNTLREALLSYGGGDDHNAAGLMVRPAGGYLAVYTGHNNNKISYHRIYDPAKGTWGAEGSYNWDTQPGGADFENSYENLFYLSAEDKTYNFSRGDQQSPNFAISSDQGATWTYGGQLTTFSADVGYVNGYFKYASNGVDRIDFTATEHHPRDFNTSIYHGYVKGGKSYNTVGTVIDENVKDKDCPIPEKFTKVFAANTVVSGSTMTRCWNIDIADYPDGTVGMFYKCRAGTGDTDHRFFVSFMRDGKWTYTYLGKAGSKLFGSEQDYTGLGALHPNDPDVLYMSTPFDPRDGKSLSNHEIFQGKTTDKGATWTWSPITEESGRDNYRPSVPAWDKDHTALVWYKGTMSASQNFDGAMIGLIMDANSSVGKKTYVDATDENTALAAGGALGATGPSAANGAADSKWHWRSGEGNGGTVLASAEAGGEDAPAIRTKVTVPGGIYDVWADFYGDPAADWRIRAGLSTTGMQVYRQKSGEQVDGADYGTAPTLTAGSAALYQAYLGRVEVPTGGSLEAVVDDFAIQTGSASTSVGSSARAWYDGISYAPVPITQTGLQHRSGPRPSGAMEIPRYDLKGRQLKSAPAGITVPYRPK
ncbi:MAG: BNR-4 repeat-containing protein [Fibrobacteria bacterium]